MSDAEPPTTHSDGSPEPSSTRSPAGTHADWLRAAVWRAMEELSNGQPEAAYEALAAVYEGTAP